ncbi:MNIO family bufferin maturase [Paucibacter soli]|uniref:MNIO family bufferin maturase n=1 Tax=Paucibacter soli TaxID=3133433 RepID=UPI0030AB90D5
MSSIQAHSFGLGLRTEHYQALAEPLPAGQRPDWLEIISENYLVPGGKPLWHLERLRRDYPVVMHGVSMSIGSSDALNIAYLRELKALADRIEPAWLSDHLCWTGVDHRNLHDLLPMPYTEAALQHLCARIEQVQDILRRPLVLENVSSYVAFAADEMDEASFVAELLRRSGCRLLLDVNNVYVSSRNHGFDPCAYIDRMPAAQVQQIHLAGHEDLGELVIDTHDHAVCPAVWELFSYTLGRLGPKPTMIERDDNIPPLADLLDELDLARRLAAEVLPEQEAA